MANESFPDYPTLADAIADAERVTVRWGYDNVRNLSEGQVAAIVAALRASTVSDTAPREYVCKCGVMVRPHQCQEGTDF
jgi:hypothetical protein